MGGKNIKAGFKEVVWQILDQNDVATGNGCPGVIKHTILLCHERQSKFIEKKIMSIETYIKNKRAVL